MVSSNKFRTIFALTSLLVATFALSVSAVKYSDCDLGTTLATIKSLDVSDCPGQTNERCIFKRDTNKTIEIKFVPNETISSAKINVKGRIGKADMPFAIHPEDACGIYGLVCPLEAGKEQTFRLSMPIKRVYPPLKVDVLIRLLDQNKKSIVCADIPAKIEWATYVRINAYH